MLSKSKTIDIGNSHPLVDEELPSFISRQVSEARRFYFDLTDNSRSRLYVALGGWERVKRDYAIQRAAFDFSSIEFVTEGRGRVILGGREFELSPGSVFGYSPNTSVEIFASSRELMSKYYVTFTGKSAHQILKLAGIAPYGFRQIVARHEIRDLFEMFIDNGLAHTEYSQNLCTSLLPTLAYKIAERSIPTDNLSTRAYLTYLRVREMIDQNYLIFKTVEQLAEESTLTVSYICQLFKRFDHISPYQYLLRQRMRYAADLLSTQGVLVKQAAKRLEFADQFQFSRAFHRVFGISPTEFQRRIVPHGRPSARPEI